MKAALHRIGEMACAMASPSRIFATAPSRPFAIAWFVVALPLLIMLLGMVVGGARQAGVVQPEQRDYMAMGAALAVALVALWASRSHSKPVARTAAVAYVLAGLAVISIEARTGASGDMGIWPTWSSLSAMGAYGFVTRVLLMPMGWGIYFWFLSALSVVGYAMQNPDMVRERVAARDQETSANAAKPSTAANSRVVRPTRKLDSMAGMAELKQQLREFASHFEHYGKRNAKVSDINGLLLGGPPGNGKTVFAEALAGELGFGFLKVGVKDLASQWINETPTRIGEAFAEAIAHAPCVLFLDEIDAIARDRGSSPMNTHAEDIKAVNALLQEIDNARRKKVVLVAASNYVDRLDAAVMRPGRFDVKIEIPLPDVQAREGILAAMLDKSGLKADAQVVPTVARLWEQRSAAFIESTVKRLREDMRRDKRSTVTVDDLKAAARAASRREGAIPKTGTPLSKLLLPAATRRDAESIVYRLRNWESLAERGGTPPTGVLLYGPPGTGKTNLVRAMALELGDWHVFEVKVAQMLADPQSFEKVLAQASEHRPAIVFLDEADDLLRDRSYSANATATNEILKAMDGMMGAVPEVVFVAATNNPDAIDAAAKRGGRFAEKIFMDLFSGDDLVAFARSELDRRKSARFAHDVTPEWIALTFGPIGPADMVAVLGKAINATLTGAEPGLIGRDDLVEAYVAIMERQPPAMA